MNKFVTASVCIVLACALSARGQNRVVFDNQSGEPALVKLVGPTSAQVEVPNGTKQGVDASSGHYTIKVRYGVQGKYHYAKGDEFDVIETAATRSETTITLHSVVGGNYGSRAISEKEFQAGQSLDDQKHFVAEGFMPQKSGGQSRAWIEAVGEDLVSVSSRGKGNQIEFALGQGGTHFWAGSETILDGKLKLGPPLNEWQFESDPAYPLTFKMIAGIGYVRLCGRGTATDKDGKMHRLGYDETVDTWLPRLKSKDQFDREGASQAMGWLTKTPEERAKAVPVLVEALQDEKMEVRRDAAEALGRLKDKTSANPLAKALEDSDSWVAWVAAEALGEGIAEGLSEANFNRTISDLKSKNRDVHLRACIVLGGTRRKDAAAPLQSLLTDTEGEVRAEAAKALGKVGDNSAKPSLLRLLDDKDATTRAGAAEGLGSLGDKETTDALVKRLIDESPTVRTSVAKALGVMRDPRALAALRELRATERNVSTARTVREAIDHIEQNPNGTR